MSNRNTWRAIGLLALIPSALLGSLPLVVTYTDFASTWSSFAMQIGPHVIAKFKSDVGEVYVNPMVWAVAGVGELILISIHLKRPIRRSRYSLKPY